MIWTEILLPSIQWAAVKTRVAETTEPPHKAVPPGTLIKRATFYTKVRNMF